MGMRPLLVVAALFLAGGTAATVVTVGTNGGGQPPAIPRTVLRTPSIRGQPEVVVDSPPAVPSPPPERRLFPFVTPEGERMLYDPGTRTFIDGPILYADPEVDPATGEAPVAAPGRPAALEIAAFVAAGGLTTDPVVELVGMRKPELEEGVPVSLAGRVLEAEGGAAVAGARVVVSSAFYVRRYFYDHHLREVARAETDSDGAWRIDRLNVEPVHFESGGRLYLTATAEGHAPALAVPLARVTPGIANRVKDVSLERVAGALRGRVLDMWEGKPVVGARVHATGAIDPIQYPKDQRAALFVGAPSAVTDGEGRFLLEGLGRGIQMVSVHGGDDCAGSEGVVIPFKGECVLRTRALRGRIEGTMTDGKGNPLALVLVEGGENTTHSFADGRFVLENFRGDAVKMTFSHPEYRDVVLERVGDGTAGLVVRMEHPRPTIVLDVKDVATAAPVKRIGVGYGSDPATPTGPEPGSAYLSADGRYVVRFPDGETQLFIYAIGWEPATVDLAGRADGEVVPVLLAPTPR